MDIINPSIDPKEVELRDVDKKIPPEKKNYNSGTTDRRRKDHLLHPRRLGRRVGDAVLVGDCWSVCLYYFFVYQEISSMASARSVGLYGICGVVHTDDPYVSIYVEKNRQKIFLYLFER